MCLDSHIVGCRRLPAQHHRAATDPGVCGSAVLGTTATIYFVREGIDTMPDFRALKPVGVIFAKELNNPKRRFEEA